MERLIELFKSIDDQIVGMMDLRPGAVTFYDGEPPRVYLAPERLDHDENAGIPTG